MSTQQFEQTYNQIQDTGNRLLNYLLEICARKSSQGDDTSGLQSVEGDINKALTALKEQKYQVAVIAAMKAGKSTFINALIGADILASESEACTVCRTDICPIDAEQTPRLLEYQQGKRKPIVLVEGEAEKIRQVFLERTRQIRETNNPDNTIRFELQYPIEAISKVPYLAGFRLVDTPGPNEWESDSFNTTALKQTALEALRTCDAILFILDYTSFKDNTNSELLKDLIEQRSEFLKNDTGKIYFILNKVDRKSEKDRPIPNVIEDLRKTLIGFGIPEPIIYPVSAWQGLLARLINNESATKENKKDFKYFFLARYMEEDEDGDIIVPKLNHIAPQALKDSGILTIENDVIQTILQNSGWNLLSDVLAKFDKNAQAIDETLITEIRGWEIGIEQLQAKTEEYIKRSDSARENVIKVKQAIEEEKNILIDQFSKGMDKFANDAKQLIRIEIEKLTDIQSKNNSYLDTLQNLFNSIKKMIPLVKFSNYKIKCENSKDADKICQIINEYCSPIIQNFWLEAQDKLIREGKSIRQNLVQKIQKHIQDISNEISKYLGNTLQVKIDANPILFPDFEFSGLDAEIKKQQQVFNRIKKETRTKTGCCDSSKTYEVDIAYKEYQIDLRLTCKAIQDKIDEQVERNKELLERVIQKQVSADFQKAEKQINDYINRFQLEFDNLLEQRAKQELIADEIIATLTSQRMEVNQYFSELMAIRELLNSWKPKQTQEVSLEA
ncbi:MAG: dynamin family protein [Rivularia sp. T60_A2020_040]|nr:dynamin family protein [Rivularia sp. T60_A2020_040]